MKLTKIAALTLALIISAGAAASCAETAESSADTTAPSITGSVTSVEEDTTEGKLTDDLPDKDYGGYSFNIYTRTNTTHYLFLTEEMTGEVLNDALFERNSKVADRFNVEFFETEYTDEGLAATNVMAGDDAYSLMNVRCTAANTMAQQNLCIGISSLPYVNLEKAYWDKELTEAIAIGGKGYTAIGSTNLTTIDFMNVLLFNKNISTDLGTENIYELVESGKWTLDKFGEIGASATRDLDGDGKLNAKDLYGILGCAKYTHVSLLLGGDVKMINMDENGYPVYNISKDERFISVFEKVFAVCNDNSAWYLTTDSTNEATAYHNMFKNSQGLFMSTMFYYIESLRDMEDEFGIIPYPKFDEEQDNYRCRISFFDTCVVPTTTSDIERTSIILEALTCESYNTVIPAYYEIALKTKYARDEESQSMLDIIMSNRVLDLGDTYFCTNIRDGFLAPMFYNDSRDIVSTSEKFTKTMAKTFERMIEAYEALEY